MMNINPNIKEINELFRKHGIHEQIMEVTQLSGTTAGRVFRLLASSGGIEESLVNPDCERAV